MADEVILNKSATIERCVARAREEYDADPNTFTSSQTRQDAAILNIQRACYTQDDRPGSRRDFAKARRVADAAMKKTAMKLIDSRVAPVRY